MRSRSREARASSRTTRRPGAGDSILRERPRQTVVGCVLVALAREAELAIVELRGGMLIHGAIIARELGIPCVNGIPEVMDSLKSGDLVTVDGHLGILTVGAPEFDLEGVTLGPYDAGGPPSQTG